MRTLIIGLVCLFLWTTVARYIYVCKIKNQCGTTVVTTTSESNRFSDLHLMEGDTPILENYEQFAFAANGIKPDLSADNNKFLDGISTYLKNNPTKKMRITGLFRPSEDGMSQGMFENLGLARANVIKDLLIQRRIDKERLILDSNRAPEDLSAPLNFSVFSDIPTEAEAVDGAITAASSTFNRNRNFSDENFKVNSAVFSPNTVFVDWADSLNTYLQMNPDNILYITGHTDNVGPAKYNEELGLDRAKAVKKYLEARGIRVPISVSSRGETNPIASNKTKAGRKKNRRVNFTLQEEVLKE